MSSAASTLSLIDGKTEILPILGDPVEQVRAPESFNLIFASLGINAVVVPVHVAAADLLQFVPAAFTGKNIQSMLLTIPHKSLVMPLLKHCGPLGQVAGAVNAVRRNAAGELEGDLFDGEGLVAALNYFGMAYAGKRVLIIGAGGASAAIGASLIGAGSAVALGAAAELALFDPVPGKAQELAQRLGAQGSGETQVLVASSNDPAGYDLVVNASPLGLKSTDPMPCDVARVEPHAALIDILMKNQPTPWVRAGRARGLHAQPGFEMLIQQAHLYLEFFGLPEAAQRVRQDATFIREAIYPAEMAGEIYRDLGEDSAQKISATRQGGAL